MKPLSKSFSHFNLIQERYPHNNTIKGYRTLLGVLSSQPRAMDWKEFNQEDWEAFARIAIQEGVAGCVYWHLKNSDFPIHVPPMTLGALGAEFFGTQSKNTQIQRELSQRIGPALEKNEKKIILIKGAGLAPILYPDLGMRPMVDLDCLAGQEDIPMIINALSTLGYSVYSDDTRLHWARFKEHHKVLRSSNPAFVPIELHAHLSNIDGYLFPININWFLDTIQPYPVGASPGSLWTFTPPAHLLNLVIHLILHHSEGQSDLLHFYDIHRLIRKWGKTMDWERLEEVSRGMNLDYILWYALKGVSDRFGTSIPSVFSQPPSGKRIRPVEKYLNFRKKQYPQTAFKRYFHRLRGLPVGMQAADILRFIFPKPDYMRDRYRMKPKWLWFLSYPLRWLIGLQQLAITIMRKMRDICKK